MAQDQDSFLQEQLLKRPLLFYIKKNIRAFSFGLFFLLITNALDAVYPLILKYGIDNITEGKIDNLWKAAGLFLLCMGTLSVTRYLWRTFFGTYHTLAAEDLRNRIFKHFTTMSSRFFQTNPLGELMSVIVNDVQSFRQGIGAGLLILVDGVLILLMVFPLMLSLNVAWTFKTLIFLPLVPFLIWKVMKMIYTTYQDQQEKLAELSAYSAETVSGIRVIKGFAQENHRLSLYNEYSKRFELSSVKVNQIDSLFGPVMQFGVASGTVILLFIASEDVLSGAVTVGTLVAFQRYITKMVWPMTALGLGLSQFQKGMASFKRISSYLNKQSEVQDHGKIVVSDFKNLEVKNLSFRYSDDSPWIFKNLNFKIDAGQSLAVIGSVGSGKTTLINLILRLFEAPKKTIFINNIPIEDVTLESLRQVLCLIPQEPFLFSDSIQENISFALNGKDAKVRNATDYAKAVDIHNEIMLLPDNYKSFLGERGVNLSGGQKQRLTLARGLIRHSQVVLLDDNLSAVDHETEEKIQSLLMQKSNEQTQIIITHRLSAAKHVTKILVLSNGQQEFFGNLSDANKYSETFNRISTIQDVKNV